jgi:tetratricopeptide (TPR) repeat protein
MKALTIAVMAFLFVFSFAAHVRAASSGNSSGCSDTQIDGITSAVVDGLWQRTDYWWHRGDYPRIIALDRLITEADPNFLEPYSNGGWLMESLGNNSDAEKYYRLGAERNPKKSYLWFSLGMFYYVTLKAYPKAIDSFHRAATAPDGGQKSWRMLAHSYERNNQMPEAIKIWQKLHAKYPTDGVIMHNLVEDQGRQQQAAPTISQ